MRLSLVIVLSLVFSVAVFAKAAPASKTKKSTVSKSNTSKFDVRVPVKKWFKNNNDKFRVGIATGSLATNIRSRGNGSDISTNESANSRFQIQFGWEDIKTKQAGFSSFVTYQDIAVDNKFLDENVRNMRVAGNVTYGINPTIYTYGGLNFGDYYGSDEIQGAIEAGFGYQVGLGIKFHKKANVEIEYLTLLNEGRLDNRNIDMDAKGIMLKINTPLTFNL